MSSQRPTGTDEDQRAIGREQAQSLGLDPEIGAQLWVQAYMRGIIDGGTKVAAEICTREGHRELEVTTNGELAAGKRVYLCGRCPTRIEITRVETRP